MTTLLTDTERPHYQARDDEVWAWADKKGGRLHLFLVYEDVEDFRIFRLAKK